MRRQLSYRDAVRILDSDESKLVTIIDKITAAALVTGAATGHLQVLAFFELRAEVVRLGQELVNAVRSKIREESGASRSERVVAAHTVLVITAYLEALG